MQAARSGSGPKDFWGAEAAAKGIAHEFSFQR